MLCYTSLSNCHPPEQDQEQHDVEVRLRHPEPLSPATATFWPAPLTLYKRQATWYTIPYHTIVTYRTLRMQNLHSKLCIRLVESLGSARVGKERKKKEKPNNGAVANREK
jgi:hypothetical protein